MKEQIKVMISEAEVDNRISEMAALLYTKWEITLLLGYVCYLSLCISQ